MGGKQRHILRRRAAARKARGGLDIVGTRRGHDLAHSDLFFPCQKTGLDDDLEHPSVAGGAHRADVGQHSGKVSRLDSAERDHHVDLRRAVFHGVCRFKALCRRGAIAVRKPDDSADGQPVFNMRLCRLHERGRDAHRRGVIEKSLVADRENVRRRCGRS